MSETNDERYLIVSVNSETTLASRPNRTFQIAPLINLIAPLCFLFVLGIVLSILTPHFHDRDNLKNILLQAAAIAILACGQTAVIISGNIDLSVGAMMALSGICAADAMANHGVGIPGAVLIACVVGLAAGAVNGFITSVGKIPSFIVTLGSMGIYYGLGGIVSKSQNIGGLPPAFTDFGSAELFGVETKVGVVGRDGIPYIILVMIGVAVVSHILLTRTRWGRSLFAIGGNAEAARLSGVRLPKTITGVFAFSGLLAGIAALVNVARSSVAAHDAGTGYELYAVAATVIGGTSLFGGQGGVIGTIIGALLMFTIRNGCALMNIKPEVERAVIGAVVILAVLYDRYGQPFFRRLLANREGAGAH